MTTSSPAITHEFATHALALMQSVPDPDPTYDACPACRAVEFLFDRGGPENPRETLWLAEQCSCGACGTEFVEATRAVVTAQARRALARSVADMLAADSSTVDVLAEPRFARLVRIALAPAPREKMTTRGSRRAKHATRKPRAVRARTRRLCG